jgi:misacylated tRNA(Ala) deacylase
LEKQLPVYVHFLARETALADPDLIRTKVNLLPDFIDPIRVIEIEGLDKQAETESKGRANKRIRIELSG